MSPNVDLPITANQPKKKLTTVGNMPMNNSRFLQPEYIVCLGATAVRGLLKVKYTIPSLREKFHQYRGSRVMVTYHPSYLLRKPGCQKMVWSDMKMLMRELGVQL